MKKWFNKNGGSLFIFIFFAFIGIILSTFEFHYKKFVLITLFYLAIYGGIRLLPKNKITEFLTIIISLPLYLTLLIKPLFGVLYLFLITITLPFSIFFWIFYLLFFLIGISIDRNILWYLSFCSITIFLIEFYEQLLKILLKIPPNDIKEKFLPTLTLSKLLIDNKKIRVLVYALYLPFLIAFSIITIGDLEVDRGILQASFFAFTTFLAYDRIRQLDFKKIEMKWKEIWKQYLKELDSND